MKDPTAVYFAMRDGTIATPGLRDIITVYGERAVREALDDGTSETVPRRAYAVTVARAARMREILADILQSVQLDPTRPDAGGMVYLTSQEREEIRKVIR